MLPLVEVPPFVKKYAEHTRYCRFIKEPVTRFWRASGFVRLAVVAVGAVFGAEVWQN
jgi:hypothetical protein